jgi:hypothetical protein
MPHYIILAKFADQGVSTAKDSPSERCVRGYSEEGEIAFRYSTKPSDFRVAAETKQRG